MGCNKCKNKEKCKSDCGCTAESLHINQICNPVVCDTDECSESFPASCIRYIGEDLICNDVIVVPANTTVAQALANIVAFVCVSNTPTDDIVTADILCGEDVVVPENATAVEALALITEYFCQRIETLGAPLVTLNDLECGKPTFTIPANTPLNEALESVFNYFCGFVDIVLQQLSELQIQINSLPVKFSSGPLTGNNLIAHNFVSTDLILSVSQAVFPPANVFIHGVDYVYTIVNSNEIQLDEVVPGGLGTYKVTIIS
jgi:hypothetical protein